MRLDSTKFHLDGGVNMAIYHFTTRIIKSSIGKCAVASAAYISGQKLKDTRLGLSFNYTRKEEVVFAEVLLPKNAPEDLADRETLWNAVEKRENKRNSQYAREFEIAVPNEWNREQTISRMREFIKENFVNKGMAADWAYHEKEGNHHVHCMCTMRAFNKDGSWSNMRKTEFARDDNGNKIPLLDENGKQKVRIRKGKGEEKLWKRIDVIQNQWNSKEQLKEWRKNWADYCNKFLIDRINDHADSIVTGYVAGSSEGILCNVKGNHNSADSAVRITGFGSEYHVKKRKGSHDGTTWSTRGSNHGNTESHDKWNYSSEADRQLVHKTDCSSTGCDGDHGTCHVDVCGMVAAEDWVPRAVVYPGI